MKLIKCPRCDLNYIQENEKLCKVCQRELKGSQVEDEMELCSVCNAAPALPGRDVCLSCLKEMASGGSDTDNDETPTVVDESTIGLNSVSTMDEIILKKRGTNVDICDWRSPSARPCAKAHGRFRQSLGSPF